MENIKPTITILEKYERGTGKVRQSNEKKYCNLKIKDKQFILKSQCSFYFNAQH